MSTLIATKKRLLSTHVNKLEHLLTKLKEANLEDTPLDPTLSRDVNLAHINELEEGISVTELSISKVEKALSDLASLFDSPNLSGVEPGDFEEYIHIMAEGNAYLADFNFISSLYKESVSADDLEKDMKTTLQEIEQHIKMARNGRRAPDIHQPNAKNGHICKRKNPKLHSTVHVVRFNIPHVGVHRQRLPEKRLTEWGEDKTHDVKQLKAKVEYQLRMLDRHISDIEEEFTRAEKRILNEKVEFCQRVQ
ncbi:hypothetical protein OSTOST_02227 [Ostertagia ostertagi]